LRKSKRPIVIASRRSELARRQAQMIGEVLGRLHTHVRVEYRWIESEGDRLADAPLADSGGKGLFVHAVERSLLAEQADIAVHSLKDVPMREQTEGLVIAAVPRRADHRDCLVAWNGATSIDQLPHGATVGTASPRRGAQLLRLRSDLHLQPLRGNVPMRLRRVLDDRAYDATLLAAAGLIRCGLSQHAMHRIDPSLVLPAAGQGALAVQCRAKDHVTIRRCLPLNDPTTSAAVHAERSIVAQLGGDCHSPIAALCEPMEADGTVAFRMRACVLSPDGQRCLDAEQHTSDALLSRCAQELAAGLIDRNAQALLAA